MDRVIIHDYEAFSDITLIPERHGVWHTPPHWIDSVSHLAGLVMNGSDASNTRDFFYVTPGYDSFRMLRKLEPGAQYQSYVRMFPIPEPNMYAGDLYILQDNQIIGMVGQLKFRRVPRLLMDRFFSAEAASKQSMSSSAPTATRAPIPVAKLAQPAPPPLKPADAPLPNGQPRGTNQLPSPSQKEMESEPAINGVNPADEEKTPIRPNAGGPNGTSSQPEVTGVVGQCLQLIANETGQGVNDLTADSTFVQLGVDSLMSLVLSEKFRAELGLEVKSSLFLECPTVGDMMEWLEQYC